MSLIKYLCSKCNKEPLVFSGEEEGRLINCCNHKLIKTLPSPVTVHATNSFTSVELMLDSIWTAHDLDRQLNIEVAYEKETKLYNKFKIEQ